MNGSTNRKRIEAAHRGNVARITDARCLHGRCDVDPTDTFGKSRVLPRESCRIVPSGTTLDASRADDEAAVSKWNGRPCF